MVELISVPWDRKAVLISRPNRFLAIAKLADPGIKETLKVHVRDPGRLTELLFPGNQLLLKYAAGPGRKTEWDLVAARHDRKWIIVNSGLHPSIARAIIENKGISPFGKVNAVRPEVKYGRSRLDFLITVGTRNIYTEIKGCTLASKDGLVAMFPDAPTDRGRRHLEELIAVRHQGDRAAVIFLVFRSNCRIFMANSNTDPAFANKLRKAQENGVEIYPVLLEYRHDKIWYKGILPVMFEEKGLLAGKSAANLDSFVKSPNVTQSHKDRKDNVL